MFLLVQRYASSNIIDNACTSFCNAIQEPGMLSNVFLANQGLFTSNLNPGSSTARMPHVFDIISVMFNIVTHHSPVDGAPNNSEICLFMSGIESEVGLFMRMNPKFFFITCRILTDFTNVDSFVACANVSFPVVFKGGHYYIIIGEENTPIYRVHQPVKLFFTFEGKLILKRLLRRNHSHTGEFDFHVNKDGKQAVYCIPNFASAGVFPGGRWDDCNSAEIESMMPHPLVKQPIVPDTHKFSVQVLELSDSENIVDIFFDGNEE
ncbi:hypothetical protein QTG54_004138 [Skeletonema marinoi]|uniref:Uncharacterized protein n=1 Tax=Skeletonema marinoi TaxID=267567 RepID=A0A7S2LFT2_9STRA|nr:hypothetical protein QTG54_004138 [Skeletonema marinoi]|mmetsp:Transcript_24236/g.41229  ORF Transcript_24236/g.41229 Transcript_24236/m.41229 type:complete len:264 (+) Transcript_24236:91-882(+)